MALNTGDFLISYPFLEDEYFFRSVICVLNHDMEGTFGIIINKKMPYNISEVLHGFPPMENNIYMGGPVDTQRLFFIHKIKELADAQPITDEIFWNGDINDLRDMIELDMVDPKDIRFYLGYSGWDPEQIQNELLENTWLIADSCQQLIFEENSDETIWRKSVASLGDKYIDIAMYPVDPQLN